MTDHIINFLTMVLAFGFALGVIIIIHEAGHLLVAKAFGVRVLTFSIGFGKKIWGFQRGETEYRVSAVPLGGYVRLGGENLDESTGDPRDFLSKPRWQRVLVYLAGPTMNVLLAIGLFAALFMVGIKVPNLPDMPPLVGGVEAGSSAEHAGLLRGDLIVAANGKAMQSWHDVLLELITSPERPVPLKVARGEKVFTTSVTPSRIPQEDSGDSAGIYPSLRPQITQVVAGGPAQKAGFRAGDEIRRINGVPVADHKDFVGFIEKHIGVPVAVEVIRDGVTQVLTVVPRDEHGVGKIDVEIGFFQRYGPRRALIESVRYNVQIIADTFHILGKIFNRQISAKSAFAGPLEIARQSGEAAKRGFKDLLGLMGFISISIAFMNLLPIPILDGGQIFILLIEEVIRRDLSLRLKEVISQVGLVMILLLMGVVLYFDVVKAATR
ncbi:MAG TPA: RIP metalloprotease RseP [Thermoanaerobaculia bacterium]|jgi:regulator of sigma E protease